MANHVSELCVSTHNAIKQLLTSEYFEHASKGIDGNWYNAVFCDSGKRYGARFVVSEIKDDIEITLTSDLYCHDESSFAFVSQFITKINRLFPFTTTIAKSKAVTASDHISIKNAAVTKHELLECICHMTIMFDASYTTLYKLTHGILPEPEELDLGELLKKNGRKLVARLLTDPTEHLSGNADVEKDDMDTPSVTKTFEDFLRFKEKSEKTAPDNDDECGNDKPFSSSMAWLRDKHPDMLRSEKKFPLIIEDEDEEDDFYFLDDDGDDDDDDDDDDSDSDEDAVAACQRSKAAFARLSKILEEKAALLKNEDENDEDIKN